jgi:hypothetical protein
MNREKVVPARRVDHGGRPQPLDVGADGRHGQSFQRNLKLPSLVDWGFAQRLKQMKRRRLQVSNLLAGGFEN